MKIKGTILFVLLVFGTIVFAQKEIKYKIGLSSAFGTENELPFWFVSNKNGIIPNCGYVMSEISLKQDYNQRTVRFMWEASGAGYTGEESKLLVDQLYVGLKWKFIRLYIGQKNNVIAHDGLSSTNGNLLYSGNARAIPRAVFSIPEFIVLPLLGKWVAVKSLYSEGYMNDKRFVKNTRVHYKNIFVKFGREQKFNFILGFHHYAQWAGISRDIKYGKLASDLENYLRVIVAKGGTDQSNYFEWENSVGNHIGGWDFQVYYRGEKFTAKLYRQTIFEDHSGIYIDKPDGVTGLFLKFKGENKWVSSLLYENYYTKYQSGSTPGGSPKPGGGLYTGMDDYFNNGIYRSGWTYFGRTIGTPFLTATKPDSKGITLGIINNRIIGHHFGIRGFLSRKLSYRTLVSYTQNYGTYTNPYQGGKKQLSGLFEITTILNQLPFEVNIAIASDLGKLYRNNIGLYVKLVKKGIF